MRKGDYIQRINGISIYCITSSEGKYVYAVRCSTYSIENKIKRFDKTKVRKLTQFIVPITKKIVCNTEIYKNKDFPPVIRLSKTKFNSRILTENPDLLTFRKCRGITKVSYTFTYQVSICSEAYIYLRLIECINKVCQ